MKQIAIFPGGVTGAVVGCSGSQEGRWLPRTQPDSWPVCSDASSSRLSHGLISCSLTFAFCFLLFLSLCLSSSLSSFLCMLLPSPALFGLFISMALISMESSHSDKHIKLNIGLCRKRKNCHSCFLPSGMIYA